MVEEKVPLTGLMQEWALTLDKFIEHAAKWHGQTEIVSRLENGNIVRTNWVTLQREAKQLTNALIAAGIKTGDRVATLAMNGDLHLAVWYGVSGMGAVCHTLNPRLSDEHLIYIINHASDRVIFVDPSFTPILERIGAACPSLERIVVLERQGRSGWDAFLAGHGAAAEWGGFDESTAAGLCYTSGTTGEPKGVLYSHRSNYLHTLAILQPDVFNLSSRDVILPVVPMFHANAWGLAFAAAAVGAKFVLPGARLDGASLYDLMESEGATFTAGVPTVWQTLLEFMDKNALQWSTLKRVMVGGAACSEALYRSFERRGIEVQHNWGMTETSPLGTASSSTAATASMPRDVERTHRLKQGRVPIGIDIDIKSSEGLALPHDGKATGYLRIRGHSVAARYFRSQKAALDEDGYFDTGDIATIDALGYMQITDRAKDVIKSGGEWISSVEMENVVLGLEGVAVAAVVGVPHPKWGERPRLYAQLTPGSLIGVNDIREFLHGRVAKWWMPNEIVIVASIPLGATGKIDKNRIRAAIAKGDREFMPGG